MHLRTNESKFIIEYEVLTLKTSNYLTRLICECLFSLFPVIYPEQVHSPSSWANHLHSSPSCHLFISIIIVLLHMVWKCSLIYFFNMASFLQIQTGTCIMACSDGVWLPLPQTFNIICSTYTTYVYIWKNILMATTG